MMQECTASELLASDLFMLRNIEMNGVMNPDQRTRHIMRHMWIVPTRLANNL